MKKMKIAGLFLLGLLLSAFTSSAKIKTMTLWAVQKRVLFTQSAHVQGNAVELEKPAKITEVKSNARSFCIWSKGKPVLCQKNNFPITGQVLPPGRYTLFPRLKKAQKKARVEIKLKYLE